VLSKTIGQKDLGVLYVSLLGLGMMINLASLKYDGQNSNEIHALAISTNLSKQYSLAIMGFRCL